MDSNSRNMIFKNIDVDRIIDFHEIKYVQLIKLVSNLSFELKEYFVSIDENGRLLCTNCDGYNVLEKSSDLFQISPIFDLSYSEVNELLDEYDTKLEEVLNIEELLKLVFHRSPYWAEKAYSWIAEINWLTPCDFKTELEHMSKSTSHTRGFQNRIKLELENCC